MKKILLLMLTIGVLVASEMGIVYGLDPNGDGFLSLRRKPNSTQIGKLYEGDQVKILGHRGKWYKVKDLNSNKVGWSHSNWIKRSNNSYSRKQQNTPRRAINSHDIQKNKINVEIPKEKPLSNTFTFSKKEPSSNSNNPKQIPSTKTIVAIGYGINKDKALKNAFKSAVQQYVGVLVDADTVVENDKIIKDEILTASNGYIQSYDEISTENDDGLVQVKIKAVVKSQKVFDKVKSLNISTVTINNSNDAYARVVTKQDAKKDAEKMLKKVVGNFFSTKGIREMIQIYIKDVKIIDDEVKNDKVPVNVTYGIKINYKVYAKKVEHIEQVFKNLGAKRHSSVEIMTFDNNNLRSNKYSIPRKFYTKRGSPTYFGFVKAYGNKFKLDIWEFPKSWKNIYPFNNNINNYPEGSRNKKYHTSVSEIMWSRLFKVVLEIKDSEGNVLIADEDSSFGRLILFTSGKGSGNTGKRYEASFRQNRLKIVIPFFIVGTNGYPTYSTINRNLKEYIDIDKVKYIKDVSVNIVDK